MRRGAPLRLGIGAIFALLASFAVAVPAQAVQVLEWSVTYHDQVGGGGAPVVLTDDFEDGVFPGAPTYFEPCGEVQAGDEAGGALSFGGNTEFNPGLGCFDVQAAGFGVSALGEITARATFQFEAPELGESYGLAASSATGDIATMILSRQPSPIPGLPEVTVIAVGDENVFQGQLVELFVFSNALLDQLTQDGSAIEFELSLTRDGDVLLPHGRFRIGDDPTFFDVAPSPLNPAPDGGALALAEFHTVTLTAATLVVPEPRVGALALAGAGLLAGLAKRRRWLEGGRRLP